MKTILTALLLAGALPALAQSPTVTTNLPAVTEATTPPTSEITNAAPALSVNEAATAAAALEASRTLTVPKTAVQIKVERARVGGIAVQAAKLKKPWNLLNPFAPMSEGDGTNNLVPNSAGGPPGLNVISCSK